MVQIFRLLPMVTRLHIASAVCRSWRALRGEADMWRDVQLVRAAYVPAAHVRSSCAAVRAVHGTHARGVELAMVSGVQASEVLWGYLARQQAGGVPASGAPGARRR